MTTPNHLNNEEMNQVKLAAQNLLPEFKVILGDKAKEVPDEVLLRFLHWKQDVKRATERFDSHLKWRKNNKFFFDDDPPLTPSKDPSLKRVLESEVIVAPDGFVDKAGNAVLVGRLRNNDMKDGRTPEDVARMVVYTIDKVLQNENAQINGVTVFHDLKGLSPKNVHPAIPKMIFSAIIGNLPIRIQGIYIKDAPFFFHGLFKVLSIMFPPKLKQRIHFVKSLKDVPINAEDFLVEHGGKRVYDTKAWIQTQIERENEDDKNSLGSIPIRS